MNILKKISLINKILKAIKNVKQAMQDANSHEIYLLIKTEVDSIINSLKKLAGFVPEAKEVITYIINAIK